MSFLGSRSALCENRRLRLRRGACSSWRRWRVTWRHAPSRRAPQTTRHPRTSGGRPSRSPPPTTWSFGAASTAATCRWRTWSCATLRASSTAPSKYATWVSTRRWWCAARPTAGPRTATTCAATSTTAAAAPPWRRRSPASSSTTPSRSGCRSRRSRPGSSSVYASAATRESSGTTTTASTTPSSRQLRRPHPSPPQRRLPWRRRL